MPKYILIILLGIVSFSVYANSLSGDFLIDDYQAILNNQKIHNLKSYIKENLRLVPAGGVLWEGAHALIWHFYGAQTFYYHLFNVLLHAGCVILLFLLLESLFTNAALSFFSALIFALHPIHTEAVSWISGGHYVLSAVFYLAALIFYIKSDTSLLNLLLAILFFIFCLFAGNAAATLPIIFIFYDILFRKNDRLRRIRIAVLTISTLTAFLFIGIFLFARNKFMHTIFHFRGPSYLIVITKALAYYLKILYLPLERGLYHTFGYNTTVIARPSPAFFLSLGVIILAVFLFFRCRKRAAPVSFGIAFALITYLPYSNIVPTCNIVSERYMYLPSLGFCVIIAFLFLKVWALAKRRVVLRLLSVAAFTLYLGSYAILTLKHNYEYRNLLYYWQTNIRNFPDGFKAYNNLAGTYYAMGEWEQAIAYSWVNLLINPEQPHVWCNLGKVYRERKDQKMARHCYEQALLVDPAFAQAAKALQELK